jgi:hypothetical protein
MQVSPFKRENKTVKGAGSELTTKQEKNYDTNCKKDHR